MKCVRALLLIRAAFQPKGLFILFKAFAQTETRRKRATAVERVCVSRLFVSLNLTMFFLRLTHLASNQSTYGAKKHRACDNRTTLKTASIPSPSSEFRACPAGKRLSLIKLRDRSNCARTVFVNELAREMTGLELCVEQTIFIFL